MSETPAAAKRRQRRIPDPLRKRTAQSCDLCRKRRCKCVPTTSGRGCVSCEQHRQKCSYTAPRKTRFYGNIDDLSDRYRCLEAIVKGAFPNDDISTAADLERLGRRMGYVMPDLSEQAGRDISLDELVRTPTIKAIPPNHEVENTSPGGNLTDSGIGSAVASEAHGPSRSRTRPSSEEPHVSLIRDKSGNEHYIGPSGTLNFLSQLRKLVGRRSAASATYPATADPAGATEFAQDETAQALEADGDHHAKDSASDLTSQGPVATSLDTVSSDGPPVDNFSPGSVTSTIASDFTRLPSTDIDEILHQFPPDEALEMLIHSYFKNAHGDFPLFHRATFEDEYELFVVQARRRPADLTRTIPQRQRPMPDWGWLGCLHMMLVFGSISNPRIPGLDHAHLRRQSVTAARTLLPQFISKCTLTNVRVLLLLSIFLHNNNERNAAWNLVGTATRISFALGMHRPGVLASFRPLEREVRKCVFCTLYSFEQFLASSLGRPSGLQEVDVEVVAPREGFLDGGSGTDAQLMSMSLRLQRILSRTRLLYLGGGKGDVLDSPHDRAGIEEVLGSLGAWKKEISQLHGVDLPWIKTADVFANEPSCMEFEEIRPSLAWKTRAQLRAVLLLHIQFHYVTIVATRPVLLREVTTWSGGGTAYTANESTLIEVAETCVRNACQLAHLIILLDSFDLINGLSGLDVFYAYCAATVLILRLLRATPGGHEHPGGAPDESPSGERELQAAIRSLVSRVQEVVNRADKAGSMRRFARVIDTLFEVVDKPNPRSRGQDGAPSAMQLRQPHLQTHHPHSIQSQQTLPGGGLGLMTDSDVISEPLQGWQTPRLGDRAIGDSWFNFLPLSTFGGSASTTEGMYGQYNGGDEMNPQDWMDMQILLGGYGVTG